MLTNSGLRLAEASLGLIVGYTVFAGVTFLAVAFVLSCLWCLGSRRSASRSRGDSPGHYNGRKSVGSRKTSNDSEPIILPENGARHSK